MGKAVLDQDRVINKWRVMLQSSQGESVEYIFESHWDQNYTGINETVGKAAAVQKWMEDGRTVDYAPISVEAI